MICVLLISQTTQSGSTASTAANSNESDVAHQPSAEGGIGNTRADVYAVRGKPERTEAIGSISFADYDNVSLGFVLTDGESEQEQDRVMDVLLYAPAGDLWTMEEATQIALGLLPLDAVPMGDVRAYSIIEGAFLDYRQQFYSEELAVLLPGDGRIYCGENPDRREKSGTIWIKLDPDYDGSTRIKDIQVTTQGC